MVCALRTFSTPLWSKLLPHICLPLTTERVQPQWISLSVSLSACLPLLLLLTSVAQTSACLSLTSLSGRVEGAASVNQSVCLSVCLPVLTTTANLSGSDFSLSQPHPPFREGRGCSLSESVCLSLCLPVLSSVGWLGAVAGSPPLILFCPDISTI